MGRTAKGDHPETVNLKYSVDYLYKGKFIIEKELVRYDANKGKVTFTFKYSVKTNDQNVSYQVDYDDYIGLTFNNKGTIATVVDNIPVGATVTVEEEYAGAYKLIDSDAGSKTVQLDEIIRFKFKNDINNDPKHGYGIDNKFEYGTDEEGIQIWRFKGMDIVNPPKETGTNEVTTEETVGGDDNA